jgi:hypothetical protein
MNLSHVCQTVFNSAILITLSSIFNIYILNIKYQIINFTIIKTWETMVASYAVVSTKGDPFIQTKLFIIVITSIIVVITK